MTEKEKDMEMIKLFGYVRKVIKQDITSSIKRLGAENEDIQFSMYVAAIFVCYDEILMTYADQVKGAYHDQPELVKDKFMAIFKQNVKDISETLSIGAEVFPVSDNGGLH